MNEREMQVTKPSKIKSGEMQKVETETETDSDCEATSLEGKSNQTPSEQSEENQFPAKYFRRVPGLY